VAVDEQHVRTELLAIAGKALDRRDELLRDLQVVIDAARDVATDDEHDPEGATIAYERAKLIALVHETEDRLADAERALVRLAAGNYETCDLCGRHIGSARLQARPTASTCLDCAARTR
jgi:RNA polymerase-binding transcription factor DksA